MNKKENKGKDRRNKKKNKTERIRIFKNKKRFAAREKFRKRMTRRRNNRELNDETIAERRE